MLAAGPVGLLWAHIVNEEDLRKASERVTSLHREAQEKLEKVAHGHKMGTISHFGGLTHESDRM